MLSCGSLAVESRRANHARANHGLYTALKSAVNKSNNLELPYDEHDKFDLSNLCEDDCRAEFRFEKKYITGLAEVLQLPPVFKCPQGSVSDDIEGLCMLLRRLAYPVRYSAMINRFARPVPVIFMITNRVLDYIYETHHHRITSWNNSILYPAALQQNADAIFDQGAALSNCFGFVDGTVRPICTPDENQRIVFNGHKRVHAIKFQSVALPNGLIGHLCGPVSETS